MFSKHRQIKRLASKMKVPRSQIVYVGDEVRDIEAARKAGVAAVSVAWGKDSEEALREAKPDVAVRDGIELRKAVAHLVSHAVC